MEWNRHAHAIALASLSLAISSLENPKSLSTSSVCCPAAAGGREMVGGVRLKRGAGPGWIGFRANGDYAVRGIAEIPLLPAALVLIAALGALLLAWRREGR